MNLMTTIRAASTELQTLASPLLSQFRRADARSTATDYFVGLLKKTERKTSWQMAEASGRLTPYATQHLLGRQNWDADASLPDLQRYCQKTLGSCRSALILDETGFIKKGSKSAGVQRQYSGTAGRVENCQVGVFLAYATRRGHTLVSRRLFMPESWSQDPERLQSVSAPMQEQHNTKIKLAIDMLEEAHANGISADWVLGGEVYGNTYKLRNWCMERKQPFALGVSTRHCMWVDSKQVRMGALLSQVRSDQWVRLSTGDGTKGPRRFDWTLIHRAQQPLYDGFSTFIVAR